MTNVNFNGLKVRGHGKAIIGDNFHSGPDILILTRIHITKAKEYFMTAHTYTKMWK